MKLEDELFELISILKESECLSIENEFKKNAENTVTFSFTELKSKLFCEKGNFNINNLEDVDFYINIIDISLNFLSRSYLLSPGVQENIFNNKIVVFRLNLLSQVLRIRGAFILFEKVNNKAIHFAQKNELYSELAEALFQKQIYLIYKGKNSESKNIEDQIQKAINFDFKLNESKIIRNCVSNISISTNRNKTDLIKEQLIKLCEIYNNYNSNVIRSILLLIQTEYLKTKSNFGRIQFLQEKLERLLKENKYLYSKKRLLIIQENISISYLKKLDFNKSFEKIKKSDKEFEGINKLFHFENRFNLLFFLGKYTELILSYNNINKGENLSDFQFFNSFIKFLYSLSNLVLNKPKEALAYLEDLKELEKDKEGWNVWIRIYRILIHIEMRKHDLVDHEIESFRKYIERRNKANKLRERDLLANQLIQQLKKETYDFNKTVNNNPMLMKKLSSVEPEMRWEVESPEKILLHEWFFAKAENRKYSPDFDPYRKQIHKESELKEKELRALPEYEAMGFDL